MQAPQFRNGAAALSLYPPICFVGLFVKNFRITFQKVVFRVPKAMLLPAKTYLFALQNMTFCSPKRHLLTAFSAFRLVIMPHIPSK